MACLRPRPNVHSMDVQNWMTASLKTTGRPSRPLGAACFRTAKSTAPGASRSDAETILGLNPRPRSDASGVATRSPQTSRSGIGAAAQRCARLKVAAAPTARLLKRRPGQPVQVTPVTVNDPTALRHRRCNGHAPAAYTRRAIQVLLRLPEAIRIGSRLICRDPSHQPQPHLVAMQPLVQRCGLVVPEPRIATRKMLRGAMAVRSCSKISGTNGPPHSMTSMSRLPVSDQRTTMASLESLHWPWRTS